MNLIICAIMAALMVLTACVQPQSPPNEDTSITKQEAINQEEVILESLTPGEYVINGVRIALRKDFEPISPDAWAGVARSIDPAAASSFSNQCSSKGYKITHAILLTVSDPAIVNYERFWGEERIGGVSGSQLGGQTSGLVLGYCVDFGEHRTEATIRPSGATSQSTQGQRTQASEPTPENTGLRVEVVAFQFWWEYRYLDSSGNLDFVSLDEMSIPVDEPVELTFISRDVIHGWWVPALAGKVVIIPGQKATSWIRATDLGTYQGLCAEFCGIEHVNMTTSVTVLTQTEYDDWAAARRGQGIPVERSPSPAIVTPTASVATIPAPELELPVGSIKIIDGSFRDADDRRRGSGQAIIYRKPDGSLLLTLENFKVTNGPDLRVLLSRHPNPESRIDVIGDAAQPTHIDLEVWPETRFSPSRRFLNVDCRCNSGFLKRIAYTPMPYKTGLGLLGVARNPANGFPARLLGRLESSSGAQSYPIEGTVNINDYKSVVIYSMPFQQIFSVASFVDAPLSVVTPAPTPMPLVNETIHYLATVGDDGVVQPNPDLIERWEVDDVGKSYAFLLSKGIRLASGAVFTSEAVFQLLEANKDKLTSYLESQPIDDFTILIRSDRPHPALLSELVSVGIAIRNLPTVPSETPSSTPRPIPGVVWYFESPTPGAAVNDPTDISQMEFSASMIATCWDSGDYTTTP